MKRQSYKKFLLLACALTLLVSTPLFLVERVRSGVVTLFSPLWRATTAVHNEKYERVAGENQLLRGEVARLCALLGQAYSLEEATRMTPARVIYRDPATWSSFLWINRGEKSVMKESPVIVGQSIVGIVDYVGKKQARVRLLSDSKLKPAVRALRGTRHLAKGILEGSGTPLWGRRGHSLKGVGFNYDFADSEGEALDLRSGMPLVQEGDVLVTTGMDGLFPPGFHVATVTHVEPLKEGAYTYELEARPTAGNLDELSHVFVIPPIGYDPVDQPCW